MYSQRNIAARSRNHRWNGKETMRSVFIAKVHASFNNVTI